MNETAVSRVIESYAVENAQNRVQIATLQEKLKEAQKELNELKQVNEKEDEKNIKESGQKRG
jgi:uncharacterized membrane protein (DUF106 family)